MSASRQPARRVALLRGVNVGGNNRLPMAGLRALVEELGCTEVVTYIQSGNVVFSGGEPRAARLEARLARAIRERFAIEVPVVLREAEEMVRAARDNPLFADAAVAADPAHVHVAFLATAPSPAQVAAARRGLDPPASPPARASAKATPPPAERLEVRGREVFLYLPGGVARTRITNAYLDRSLGTIATLRNWRTVTTLVQMVQRVQRAPAGGGADSG